MSAEFDRTVAKEKLRARYKAAMPVSEAAKQVGVPYQFAYEKYRRWANQDGDRAVRCTCGRPIVHAGRCNGRKVARNHNVPIYDGPAMIGRRLTPAEEARFRSLPVPAMSP